MVQIGKESQSSTRGRAQGLIVALVAALIVVVPPAPLAANANIIHNDISCDLTGNGTENDPYLIGTPDDLYETTDCVVDASTVFRLTNNIDLTGATNSPIGFSQSLDVGVSSSAKIFSGVLDGAGYSIQNISISSNADIPFNATTSGYVGGFFGDVPGELLGGVGLFWYLGDVDIRNLAVSGQVRYTGAGFTNQYSGMSVAVGLLSGYGELVSLSNVTANASVLTYEGIAGGLVGATFGGSFENVSMSGDVEAIGYVSQYPDVAGGFAGYSVFSSVQDSTNYANVSSSYQSGGFLGFVFQSSISGSSNYGAVTGYSDTGGLAGGFLFAEFDGGSYVAVVNSSNFGLVTGRDARVGGLLGNIGNASIQGSHNYGEVNGAQGAIGGLAGRVQDTISISSSSNNAAVFAGYDMSGGLVGSVGIFADIEDSTNSATVSGIADVGGLLGEVGNANIQNSHNTGNIDSDIFGGSNVGGLVGNVSGSDTVYIWSSSNTGDVFSGNDHVGGLVGYVDYVEIYYSHNHGQIQADDEDAGGLVGDSNESVTIVHSANFGNVVADDDAAGGLVGTATGAYAYFWYSFNVGNVGGPINDGGGLIGDGSWINIYESFNTGSVSADVAGGLIGDAWESVQISNSYNAGEVIGAIAGGLIGEADTTLNLTNTYNSGAISGSEVTDGLAALLTDENLTLVSSYTLIPSLRTSASTIEQMRTLELYIDWNFSTVWGFGACADNNGLPLLRFAGDYSYSSVAGCEAPAQEEPVQIPNTANYDGPIIQFVSARVSNDQTGLVRGTKLNQIEQILVGNKPVSFKLNEDGTIAFDAPSDLSSGRYEVRFVVPRLGVSLYGSIQVGTQEDRVVNAGSFRGYVALYAKGYEGARLTAKVGNDWVVVPKIPSNGLFRVVEYTGAGYTINVRIFVDRVLIKTITLTTK